MAVELTKSFGTPFPEKTEISYGQCKVEFVRTCHGRGLRSKVTCHLVVANPEERDLMRQKRSN